MLVYLKTARLPLGIAGGLRWTNGQPGSRKAAGHQRLTSEATPLGRRPRHLRPRLLQLALDEGQAPRQVLLLLLEPLYLSP